MIIAYFDCFSGASGDMILGAMMDAGLPLDTLGTELGRLNVEGYRLDRKEVVKAGIRATQALVQIGVGHDRHATHLDDIRLTITKSNLSPNVKDKSLQIFERLAAAETRVHGVENGHARLHEVGALDSLIDVVGSVIGFSCLGIEKAYCSSVNVGGGTVTCSHGVLPVPAPATLELIKGNPIYSSGVQTELLTPTGAAILTSLCSDFAPMPNMVVECIGYGAGKRDLESPNVLRLSIGNDETQSADLTPRTVGIIETNIDDMNPQLYDHLISRALEIGGLDICLHPNCMKKNRPGVSLQVICPIEKIDELAKLIFTETTAIGVRWRIENRIVTERVVETITTDYGNARIKIASFQGRIVNIKPEYDDCKKLAQERRVPIKKVMAEVIHEAGKMFPEGKTK